MEELYALRAEEKDKTKEREERPLVFERERRKKMMGEGEEGVRRMRTFL